MKAIIVLAVVSAVLVGCGKGGSSDDTPGGASTTGAQIISGTYAFKSTGLTGDVFVMIAKFSNGQYEMTNYHFPLGNMTTASYLRWQANEIVTGDVHTATLYHATCPILNGVTVPTISAFQVTDLNNGSIMIHSNAANGTYVMDKVASAEQTLADLGMHLAIEVTNCSAGL